MRSRSMTPFLPDNAPVQKAAAELPGIFQKLGNFKTDDYILLGIIAVLFFEGCDDYILLAALGYLFVMGIM